ncbi:Protein CBG25753 [Caenorhabditis briggsae]|uniref:Protein CBG25753 n=1 Tax=Caenorhabditis briggsae TaxID=6238 RepID=B6IHS4_CAEBR|nr:Protein CBG25753 [Caenorhabditis briggsae]CAR99454.1 Protein CBG25753 [Caenorhabditis briggsae]
MANQFDPNQAADLFGFNENFTTPMFQLAHNLGANHQQYPEIHNQLMVQYLFIQQQVLQNQYLNFLPPVQNFQGMAPQTPQNNPTAALQQLENHQGDAQDERLSVAETSEEAISDSEFSLSSLLSVKDVIENNQKTQRSQILHAHLLRELENQGNVHDDNPVPPSPGLEENAYAVVPSLVQLSQLSSLVELPSEHSVEIPNYEVDIPKRSSEERKSSKKNQKNLSISTVLEKETPSEGVVAPKRKIEEGEESEQNKKIKVVSENIKKELEDSSEMPGSALTPPAASEEISKLSGRNLGSNKQKKTIVFKLKNGPCLIRAVLGSDVTSPPENVTIEDLRTPEQVARDARRLRRAAQREAEAAKLIPAKQIKMEIEDDEVQCLSCAQWYHVFCLTQSNREYQKAFFCCNHPSAGMALAAKKGVVFNKYWSVPNPRKMKSSSSTRVPVYC